MHFSLSGVPFDLMCGKRSDASAVSQLLHRLFSLTPLARPHARSIRMSVHFGLRRKESGEGASSEIVFSAPGLLACRTSRGFQLESGESCIALDPLRGKAEVTLSSSFIEAPPEEQRGLFVFAFLLLLSGRGLYALHAAGVSYNGFGFLLSGKSGSGKTTLTCALARSGWEYLSDDAVLLRESSTGPEALAFGRPFNCAPAAFRHFPEIPRGPGPPVRGKHLADVSGIYSARAAFSPRGILFPEIVDSPHTRLIPLDPTAALLRLLREGAGFLQQPEHMAAQMHLLANLARSTRAWRLLHGADVHRDPSSVSRLLRQLTDRTHKGADTHDLCPAA